MFTCWLIVNNCVGTVTLHGSGSGSNGDAGSSWLDLLSDWVTEDGRDSESEEAVGDDLAVMDGTMVSVCGHAMKQLLERGWSLHARIGSGYKKPLDAGKLEMAQTLYSLKLATCSQLR